MESALSPNTAAFLDYLSTQLGNGNEADMSGSIDPALKQPGNINTSLPPSAFFQLPDTKPIIPPISASSSQSPPDRVAGRSASLSASEGDSPALAGAKMDKGSAGGIDGMHKRKAGLSHTVEEDEGEDDDSESDAPGGHEDKRQHHNDKPTKKGGRKSGAGDEEKPGKEMTKAARRKEQNRAAQKAFRERREARVTDLEAKVAELESKSYSSTVENENLRSILKRLQEENVRLKQSAFTFAMPRAGSTSNSSPTDQRGPSPINRVGSKPPTPPDSQADEPLKSVGDVSPVEMRPPHRTASSGMSGVGLSNSPESLQSVGSSNSSRNVFNGNSPMRFDSFSNFSSTDTGITPPSVGSDNKSDFDALWASFYPGGANGQQQQQAGQMAMRPNTNGQQGFTQQQYQAALASPNPLSQFLATQMAQGKFIPQDVQQPTATTQAQPNMVYRDPSANSGALESDWSTANNTSIDDFLASLNGASASAEENPVSSVDDDLFNQQLQQILAGTGFDGQLGNNTFSPTNYLNMSPSPLQSISNTTSPQSAQVSGASYSASPESSNASSAPPKELPAQVPCPPGQAVNVVDANGNVIKPSDLWVKMGMQHQDNVDNLLIDDLCDQMRAKATCSEGRPQLHIDDVEEMMHRRKHNSADKVIVPVKDNAHWGTVFNYAKYDKQ